MRIAVLGAGVTGLTAARKLHEYGFDTVVYESCSKVGGLAKSRVTDGFVYDPHGGHVFNSKNREIVDWVFSILPKESWQFSVRNAKIYYGGKFVSYPFELSLCELPVDDAVDCAYGFMASRQGDEPSNFADWLVWNFGEGIASAYMLPYNRKIWSYPLEQMGVSWMSGKMPLPSKKEILRSLASKSSSERKMPHSTFYYPIDGGIQAMVDAIAKPLSLKLSTPVESIEADGGKWRVNGDRFDAVISTLPLKTLPSIMHLPEKVASAIDGLKFNSLMTFLADCPPTSFSWLYIPSSQWLSHRIGYQSSLSPNAAPNGSGSGAFEIICQHPIDSNENLIVASVPEQLGLRRIIDAQFTEYAYVIHDLEYPKNVSTTRGYFNGDSNFFSIGRWGSWNYRNMDMCMLEALDLVEKIRMHA
jgi:protoporphyrinogen oxidase